MTPASSLTGETTAPAGDRAPRPNLLPAAPVVPMLLEWHRRHLAMAATASEYSWQTLSRLSGIPDRSIRRWVSGESNWIELSHADRIALALGLTLHNIWDHDMWPDEKPDEIECAEPSCRVAFAYKPGKRYCSRRCLMRTARRKARA